MEIRFSSFLKNFAGIFRLPRKRRSSSEDDFVISSNYPSDDGTARLWQLESFDALLDRSCDRLGNYLKNNLMVNQSDRYLCNFEPALVTSINQYGSGDILPR
jgi:hypothetical protein